MGKHACNANFFLAPGRIATCQICGRQWPM